MEVATLYALPNALGQDPERGPWTTGAERTCECTYGTTQIPHGLNLYLAFETRIQEPL